MRLTHICLAVLVLGVSVPAHSGTADLAEIDRAVERFTGSPAGVEGGARYPVDRRLKLADCAGALDLQWYGVAHDSVLVSCRGRTNWRLYVPVSHGERVPESALVVARGDVVSVQVQGSGFSLSRTGEALDAGAAGGWIRVRLNGRKPETLRARVLEPGRVGMDLP